MFRKYVLFLLAAVWLFIFTSPAFADSVCTKAEFGKMLLTLSSNLDTNDKITEIPDEYKKCNKHLKEAAAKGLVPLDYITDGEAQVIKQDAARFVYNLLITADSEFEISSAQAEEILNFCYDNAYIREENKIAYASMIRHGIIGIRGKSNPNEPFTDAAAEAFMNQVNGLFKKSNPITIGGKTISIGSSENEIFTKFGDPDRIDAADNGARWYIFNSNYLNFIAIGIKDGMVWGYFTNAAGLDRSNLPSKSQISYTYTKNGDVDGVYLNLPQGSEEFHKNIIFDVINAYRAKTGRITFISKAARTLPTTDEENTDKMVKIIVGDGFAEAYEELKNSDIGEGILSHPFGMASELTAEYSGGAWEITATDARSKVVELTNLFPGEEEIPHETPKKLKTPEIISPKDGDKTKGGNLKLKLKTACADKYMVQIFNCETEEYDVYAYIKSDKPIIEIPGYVLTEGNMYRALVTAVSDGKELWGNTVEFTHGNAETRISIVSPSMKLSTYDDELEVSLYSSAYRDFRIDVYDKNDKCVLTHELDGTNECILPSLAPGKYYLCATAISHADGLEKGNAFTTVEIKPFEPIINEFILEPGETFDYYYGEDEEWIYLYDTETIAVTKEVITTVIVPDMAGDPDPEENYIMGEDSPSAPPAAKPSATQTVTPVTVYKTKITQRILPATKRFKALAGILPRNTGTNGSFNSKVSAGTPTQTGNAIATMALSYRGVPYLWGGTTPSGFDCSGLVKYICNSLGIKNVARTSREQFARSGVSVKRDELIPGDLLFFQKNGEVHHVGIYIGNNMFVHAPHTGDVVKISSLQDAYYDREYAGAKRVF